MSENIFYPEFDPQQHNNPLLETALTASDIKTLNTASWLLRYLNQADNIALTSDRLLADKTQFKKARPSRKSKYRPLSHGQDQAIVDLKIDLELALKQEDFDTLTALTIRIYRIING